uniref:Uncharacterized protein n=1 Tax=Vitis vinifera TaxID=29760 RepID=A5C0N0_VITVI|nr:hypothetical protein VITISV_041166 [Vitis vinifera]
MGEMIQAQKQQAWEQNSGSLSFNGSLSKEEEEMSKSALSTFRAKEEEIEKKKLEVREKVQVQLGRVEEETRRLATIREELEALADPMRKEVAQVRKKIDSVNRDLKPLGQSCQKKLVSESERLRMKKLEELIYTFDYEILVGRLNTKRLARWHAGGEVLVHGLNGSSSTGQRLQRKSVANAAHVTPT